MGGVEAADMRTAHGYEFKVSYSLNGSEAEVETLYGTNDRELVERVRSKGVEQFAIARTNLEDIYLALTGEKDGLDGDPS